MTSKSSLSRDLSAAAEREMRMWALRMEEQTKLDEQRAGASAAQLIYPFIAVSRESGVNAGEIGALVASKLQWKVLDREILDYMAEHYQWSRIALEYVDERTASWFHEIFGKWLDKQLVSQAEYVSRLGRIVLMAAQAKSTVFIGRGAQFLLPRDVGLAVRIIDQKQRRIQKIMERFQMSSKAAEEFMETTDKGRADFVQRYFHRDVADPHLYDLVISLEHTSNEAAAELILNAHNLRVGSGAQVSGVE
jgi:cytidylate kinase